MAPPDTVLDAGHLPLEIMQKIAGRMDFRDWGRAAASACRMFHTLQPGTLYQCCVHYLQTPEGFRPALIVHAVLVAEVIRCSPRGYILLSKAAQRWREATAIFLNLKVLLYVPLSDLLEGTRHLAHLKELHIRCERCQTG